MSNISAKEITNLYLYGTSSTPIDLADSGVIRPSSSGVVTTSVDVNDYMDGGPGRFASPAFFEVIKLFFSSTSSKQGSGCTFRARKSAT